MLFNSSDFLLLFALVFVLQWMLPHRPRNLLLLGISYLFYGAWDWRFLALIWLSTVIDWFCGQRIQAARETDNMHIAKRYVTLSVVSNLSMLGFFKYFDFFVGSAADLLNVLGWQVSTWHLGLVLPVGISFYTFQTISYSVDIYRGDVKPAKRFSDFALFVAFFPQLVAGPIERAKNFLPQLEVKPIVTGWQLRLGAWLFMWGMFKKVVIADNLSGIVDSAFAADSISGGDLWIAALAFAVQLYCDFSGYSDMARGLAKMMGYELTLNFRLPYFSQSPSDYFRRWHISLMHWFRDYVYIPLGGSRYSRFRTMILSALVLVLSGLWHGPAWNFVMWGVFWAVVLIISRLVEPVTARIAQIPASRAVKTVVVACKVLGMFMIISTAHIIFRSDSWGQILWHLEVAYTDLTFTAQSGYWLWQMLVLGWILIPIQYLQLKTGDMAAPMRLPFIGRVGLYALLILGLLMFSNLGSARFIYFQF